jgi:hypothetical protein
MTMTDNGATKLILQIDIPTDKYDDLLELFEQGFNRGVMDGYYILTRNHAPVKHKEEHLAPETRLGIAIAAIQNDDILIRSLADTDPETGIEYGDIT